MVYQLNAHYGGAKLALDFTDSPHASLFINGMQRDQMASRQTNITLQLSSTVQTDYEWHEFIEATVEYHQFDIKATLTANKRELKSLCVARNHLENS